jgi:hypothetical protein
MDREMTREEAERAADRLAREIQASGGSLDCAFMELEKGLAAFKMSGLPIESLLPTGEHGLGFRIRNKKSGKSFWETYSKLIRKSLCSKRGELSKAVKAGAASTAGSLVSWIIVSLGLPPEALVVAVPIAGIISTTGVDAFCESRED